MKQSRGSRKDFFSLWPWGNFLSCHQLTDRHDGYHYKIPWVGKRHTEWNGPHQKGKKKSHRVNSSKTVKDWYHKISPSLALFFLEDHLIFSLLLISRDSEIHVKTCQVKSKLVALVISLTNSSYNRLHIYIMNFKGRRRWSRFPNCSNSLVHVSINSFRPTKTHLHKH